MTREIEEKDTKIQIQANLIRQLTQAGIDKDARISHLRSELKELQDKLDENNVSTGSASGEGP